MEQLIGLQTVTGPFTVVDLFRVLTLIVGTVASVSGFILAVRYWHMERSPTGFRIAIAMVVCVLLFIAGWAGYMYRFGLVDRETAQIFGAIRDGAATTVVFWFIAIMISRAIPTEPKGDSLA